MKHFDVAIVGSGMIGATLATLLNESGFRIALIDAGPQTLGWKKEEIDTRVSAITAASRALFTSLDVWSGIESRRVSPYTRMQVWDSEGLGEVNFSAEDVGASFLGHIVENSAILDTLLEHLYAAENVTLMAGQQVMNCDVHDSRSRYQCERSLTLGDGETLTADLIVGADGGRSMLRNMVGINVSERSTGQRAIVASVRHSGGHQQTARQVFLPTGPLAFLPLNIELSEQNWSSIVWSADESRAGELMELDDETFSRALEAALEQRLGRVETLSVRRVFPLIQRHAERYVLPGFALVGDAAHSIHPLAGQGANLGLMDVAVLAEELTRARKRGAAIGDERVLTHYARRRRTDNSAMLGMMDAFRLGFGSRQPAVRLIRNLGLQGVDRFSPLKRILIRQALGERSDLPKRIDQALKLI